MLAKYVGCHHGVKDLAPFAQKWQKLQEFSKKNKKIESYALENTVLRF